MLNYCSAPPRPRSHFSSNSSSSSNSMSFPYICLCCAIFCGIVSPFIVPVVESGLIQRSSNNDEDASSGDQDSVSVKNGSNNNEKQGAGAGAAAAGSFSSGSPPSFHSFIPWKFRTVSPAAARSAYNYEQPQQDDFSPSSLSSLSSAISNFNRMIMPIQSSDELSFLLNPNSEAQQQQQQQQESDYVLKRHLFYPKQQQPSTGSSSSSSFLKIAPNHLNGLKSSSSSVGVGTGVGNGNFGRSNELIENIHDSFGTPIYPSEFKFLHPLYFTDFDERNQKRNSNYMCHFKLCQLGASGKRRWSPNSWLYSSNNNANNFEPPHYD